MVKAEAFDYSKIDSLDKFEDSHPKVMQKRIGEKNGQFEFDLAYNKTKLKDQLKQFAARYLGWEIGYKNYKKV